ncbi:MAG: hypothetical protein K4305_09025 [Chlorobium sp.]|uniref:hypothetical protein n=1 Tax=Chlorobium sp. TaxID=1095 RepID=UPI002F425AB0
MTMPLVQQIIPQRGELFDAAPVANLISGYKKKLKDKKMSELRNRVASGDEAATREFITIDPEEGKRIADAFGAMDENERKSTSSQIDKVGRIAHYVLSGGDDNERAQRYSYARQNSEPEIAGQMPEQYNPAFVQYHLSRATEMKELLENPDVKTLGGYDVAYQRGLPISRPTPNMNMLKMANDNTQADLDRSNKIALKGMEDGGSGVPKSADEALIYRQAAGLFGGTFDQAGNLIALDASARPRVQAIATEAAKLFASGKYSRSESVTIAARKYGVNVDDGTQKPGAPAAGKTIKPFM